MAAVAYESEYWLQGCDANGRRFWRHRITQEIIYYWPTMTASYVNMDPGPHHSQSVVPSYGSHSKPSTAPVSEDDGWSTRQNSMDETYYYNCVTGAKQYNKPDCLKKYDPRHSGTCTIM